MLKLPNLMAFCQFYHLQFLSQTLSFSTLDTTEVEIDPSKMLEAIKVNANGSTSTQHVIEIDGQRQVLNIGDNQHIILLQEGHESEVVYNYCEENQPVLRFGSYSEFKCALNEYESQTITKFILRNQSKQFTAPGSSS